MDKGEFAIWFLKSMIYWSVVCFAVKLIID